MGMSSTVITALLVAFSATLYIYGSGSLLKMLEEAEFGPTLMGVTKALLGVAGVTAMAATLCNIPVSWYMSSEKATLKYLENSRIQMLDSKPRNITASELWKNNGVVIMAVRRPG